MQTENEITIAAKVENLDAVNAFVEEFSAPLEPTPRAAMQLDLVVEELFVNVASYAYGDFGGMATIKGRLFPEDGALSLTFIDSGTPYNPLEKEDPDTDLPMEERGIGGLGIFLVKKNVNDIKYERLDGKNVLTIHKKMK